MNKVFQKAKEFIYRNARPLDLARFRYHFENGSTEDVLNALAFYQNEDGGFGHALEPDSWNPNSSPIQTWYATEILREIGFTDSSHPITAGILKYLESGRDFDGRTWSILVKSTDNYPHAPWWDTVIGSTMHDDYNPTACLAGFILKIADKGSSIHDLGCRLAKEAFDSYMNQGYFDNMGTVSCYVRLMQYVEEAGMTDLFDINALKDKPVKQVERIICKDTSVWETSYICKPSQFFSSRDSIFYDTNRDIAEYECDFIINTQLEDGSWGITWKWIAWPDEWAVSRNWWKSNVVITNLLYLRGFDKL